MKALIGHTGFVGSTLKKQACFEYQYNSSNINEIDGSHFDLVVCSAAPAQKWLANKNPKEDRKNLETLFQNLNKLTAGKFILISTVDVFDTPIDVDEDDEPSPSPANAYGSNRFLLERFVKDNFESPLIVRLPGLVGPRLKKNALFDFKHNNNINLIDSRAVFQFYPMVNIWRDIEIALKANLDTIHFTSEPIDVETMVHEGYGVNFKNHVHENPANYDFKTKYAHYFGVNGEYQYKQRDVIQAIRSYNQYT